MNLPSDRDFLEQRIENSLRSFAERNRRLARGRLRLRPRRHGGGALRRHLDDPRQARPPRRALLLARRDERGAPQRRARQALRPHEAPAAIHRGRPHRDRRPDPRPGLPRPPGEVRQGALDRALRLHLHAPGALRARGHRRDALALRGAGEEPAVGRLRRALHRAALPRGRPPLVAQQAVHRRPLPARSRLRHALPRGGAGRDRQDQRDGQGGAAHPREDRLPLPGPGGPLRRRPLLRRGARGHRLGARAAPAGAPGAGRSSAPSRRTRRWRCWRPTASTASARRSCRSTPRARRWSRSSAARRWAWTAATAST